MKLLKQMIGFGQYNPGIRLTFLLHNHNLHNLEEKK